jgi:hypothetical protein
MVDVTVSSGTDVHALPAGTPIRNPMYVPVDIRGSPSTYWVALPDQDLGLDSPEPHGAGYLMATKRGYRVRLYVEGSGHSQKSRAIEIMTIALTRR